ncbi:MAG: hypothetical protein ABSF52_05535 [Syntrophobacteraceae bacterium]|jgi:hypothetical protein
MRKILCIFLTGALCVISGCYLPLGDDLSDAGKQSRPEISQVASELRGPHYAKLNSIGCLAYSDMTMANAHRSDFDTIDNLIREKRCFVIPTDTDIFIIKRAKGDIDIVWAKTGDPAQSFYTSRNNLVAK